jgi:hypothetical protein
MMLGLALASAYAQEKSGTAKILDIKLERANLPGEVRGQAVEQELNGDWFMVEAKFSTDVNAEQVQVKFYVEAVQDTFATEKETGEAKEKGAYLVLTGDQTYLNVPKGREHYAAMFLDPMSLIRYGGKDGVRAFRQLNVHVQVSMGANIDAEKDMKQDDAGWFDKGQQVSGVLIGLKDSPWWPSQTKRYNRVKGGN